MARVCLGSSCEVVGTQPPPSPFGSREPGTHQEQEAQEGWPSSHAKEPQEPVALGNSKVLWFENNSRVVVLALREGHEVEELLWFLEELNKDTETLQEAPAPPAEPVAKAARTVVPRALEDIVKESLEKLELNEQCLRVNYINSRNSFRIQRLCDKAIKEVYVRTLKKKLNEALEQDNLESVNRAFLLAVTQCIGFLDGLDAPETSATSSSSHQALAEAPAEEAPAEAPAQASAEAPAQAPAGAPAEALAEAPAKRRIRKKISQILDKED